MNFVHGLPLCAVSIGLCENGVPVLGVVYHPSADELYVGVRGEGSYLNGRRLATDGCKSLVSAMVLTCCGYERSAEGAARIATAYAALLLARVRAVRMLGSTVLHVCHVAAGRASAMYSGIYRRDCPKPWDWCAAHVIATEAGAVFRRLPNDQRRAEAPAGAAEFNIRDGSACCAGSAALADELHAVLADAMLSD